jgi:type VII secretion-associated serine protease mycosin
MRRLLWPFALVLAGGLFLVPWSARGPERAPEPEFVPPDQELAMKRQLLQKDVRLTDELCRNQCLSDFRHTVLELESFSASRIEQALREWQSKHPQMKRLIWFSGREAAISVGDTDERIRRLTEAELNEAKQRALRGETYMSGPLESDGERYFVLGVPAPSGESSLIGVVHQQILRKVADHQNKNLRIVPYPADHRWKIESVDSDTLRDVKVEHPEDNEGTSHYHINEVVVKFRKLPTDAEMEKIRADIDATLVRKLDHTYVFQSSHMEMKELVDYFRKWDIEYAEPHYLYLTNTIIPPIPADDAGIRTQAENGADLDDGADAGKSADAGGIVQPNDALYAKYQWNLPIIETEAGWKISTGGDVPVGIVDTGVDPEHPDLKDHLQPGYNVLDTSASPADDVGHGTHVAGVVAAVVNNSLGIAGMTWVNPVIPVKVLDDTGAGSTYGVAQGIIWAADHGAKVINLSLGNYADANFLHDAIRYAFDKDVIIVAASGNDNTSQPGYPAAYPEVLAVAATDENKNRASFSNYGDYIDVAAPGVGIASTYPGNQYAALSGTSMASPHVAALAALIRSVNPTLKNTEVMDIIRQTAEDLGPPGKDPYFGYGQIDVAKALRSAKMSGRTLADLPHRLSREYELIKARYARK